VSMVICMANYREIDMSSFERGGLLAQAALRFKQIRTRTWLMLGAGVLGLIALMVWAAIAILSWLWSQAPTVTSVGRFADGVVMQAEQVAPGLREQAEQWLPSGLREQAEQWVPTGVKEQAGKWLPGLGTDLPEKDVSGNDVGPVSRYPGLVRSHFSAGEESVLEVGYVGHAELEAVLAHYVQGFAAVGYDQEVISATPEGEQHRFQRGQEAINVELMRRTGGLLELRMKQTSQQ